MIDFLNTVQCIPMVRVADGTMRVLKSIIMGFIQLALVKKVVIYYAGKGGKVIKD